MSWENNEMIMLIEALLLDWTLFLKKSSKIHRGLGNALLRSPKEKIMGNSVVRVWGEQIQKYTFDTEKSIVVTRVFFFWLLSPVGNEEGKWKPFLWLVRGCSREGLTGEGSSEQRYWGQASLKPLRRPGSRPGPGKQFISEDQSKSVRH